MKLDEFQKLVARFRCIADRYTLTPNLEEKQKLAVSGKRLAQKAKRILEKQKKKSAR
jgi:hypothetical protein